MNYYKLLEINESASNDEIKKAYKKMAMKYHPDRNNGSKVAEEKFKQINIAYETLSDPEKRKKYDFTIKEPIEKRYHRENNIFEDIFNRNDFESMFSRYRNESKSIIKKTITINSLDAQRGKKVELNIGNKYFQLMIPAGIKNKNILKIQIDNEIILELNIIVKSIRGLKIKNNDIYMEIKVPLKIALLGGNILFNSVIGNFNITVPENLKNEQKIRLKGKGINNLGDLYLTCKIEIPTLNQWQKNELKTIL